MNEHDASLSDRATDRVTRRGEFVGVQYLRGMAALMVAGFHLTSDLPTKLPGLRSGVDIFFVISGFVMLYSTNGGRIDPVTFLRRRLVRIVPLYWAATCFVIAALLVAPELVRTAKLDWPHAIASLFFLPAPNPGTPGYLPLVIPGWTLNLEMFFYVILAAAILLARGRTAAIVGIVATALLALVVFAALVRPGGVVGFYAQPIVLEFVLGAVLGAIFVRRPISVPWRIGLPVSLAALAVLLLLPFGEGMDRLAVCGVPALLLVLCAASCHVPEFKLLRISGDISYSLYLSHPIVLSAVAQVWAAMHMATGPVFVVVGLLAVEAAGYLCWRFVEVPLTRMAQLATHQRVLPVSLRT